MNSLYNCKNIFILSIRKLILAIYLASEEDEKDMLRFYYNNYKEAYERTIPNRRLVNFYMRLSYIERRRFIANIKGVPRSRVEKILGYYRIFKEDIEVKLMKLR